MEKARQEAERARQLLAGGIDPSQERKQAKQAAKTADDNEQRKTQGLPLIGSYEETARQWLVSISHTTRPITHQKKLTFMKTRHRPGK